MTAEALGWWGVPLAIAAGTMRGGTPFLFVSLGECLTEKSGKINLGLEGTLLTGAMSAYAISYLTGSPWLGVLAAGLAGVLLGLIHGWLSQQPSRQRCRRGHRHDHFWQRGGFFLRQAVYSTFCCATADDQLSGRINGSGFAGRFAN
jgi:hypothetical protein